MVLYRHWTLYDSLCNSEYTACKYVPTCVPVTGLPPPDVDSCLHTCILYTVNEVWFVRLIGSNNFSIQTVYCKEMISLHMGLYKDCIYAVIRVAWVSSGESPTGTHLQLFYVYNSILSAVTPPPQAEGVDHEGPQETAGVFSRYGVRESLQSVGELVSLEVLLSILLLFSSLPLSQCKQKFSAMEVQYRENLKQWIDDRARKYGLVLHY